MLYSAAVRSMPGSVQVAFPVAFSPIIHLPTIMTSQLYICKWTAVQYVFIAKQLFQALKQYSTWKWFHIGLVLKVRHLLSWNHKKHAQNMIFLRTHAQKGFVRKVNSNTIVHKSSHPRCTWLVEICFCSSTVYNECEKSWIKWSHRSTTVLSTKFNNDKTDPAYLVLQFKLRPIYLLSSFFLVCLERLFISTWHEGSDNAE